MIRWRWFDVLLMGSLVALVLVVGLRLRDAPPPSACDCGIGNGPCGCEPVNPPCLMPCSGCCPGGCKPAPAPPTLEAPR